MTFMRIATLGPEGTYSEKAAETYAKRLGNKEAEIVYTTVENSLHLVEMHRVDVAVVPVENMVDGIVGSTLDALIEYHDFVKVCDEVSIKIDHVIAGEKGSTLNDIECVFSHSSALSQCSGRLSLIVPNATHVPVASTAEAASLVKKGQGKPSAAICSRQAVKQYRLSILSEDIQDYSNNTTRFMACGLTDSIATGTDKTLLAIRPGKDSPGLLYSLLGEISKNGANLTFIQSRPYKIRPRDYVFVLELEGHKTDTNLEAAIAGIERQIKEIDGWKKTLGSYPDRGIEE